MKNQSVSYSVENSKGKNNVAVPSFSHIWLSELLINNMKIKQLICTVNNKIIQVLI